MAIQKGITDEYGATHADSYTIIGFVHISGNSSNIQIQVYHNVTARSKADISQQKTPCLVSHIEVSKTDNATYFADSVLLGENKSPIKQAYAWLKTQTDIGGLDFTKGTTDV